MAFKSINTNFQKKRVLKYENSKIKSLTNTILLKILKIIFIIKHEQY